MEAGFTRISNLFFTPFFVGRFGGEKATLAS